MCEGNTSGVTEAGEGSDVANVVAESGNVTRTTR